MPFNHKAAALFVLGFFGVILVVAGIAASILVIPRPYNLPIPLGAVSGLLYFLGGKAFR